MFNGWMFFTTHLSAGQTEWILLYVVAEAPIFAECLPGECPFGSLWPLQLCWDFHRLTTLLLQECTTGRLIFFFSSAELRCGLLSSLIDMVISLVWVADILSAAFLIGLTTLVLGCDAVSSLLPYELILPLLPLRLFLLSIYGFVASSYDSGVSVCAFISTIVDLAHMISTLCLLTLDLVREYFPLTINIVAYR